MTKLAKPTKKVRKHPLLKFAGKWKGKDLMKCLKLVYKTRGKF